MKKYRCINCGKIHSWREWETLAADPESGISLINITPGYTMHDMEIQCSCGKKSRLYRYLICRECKHGELDSVLSNLKDASSYKCSLGKSPNGKCWEEREYSSAR